MTCRNSQLGYEATFTCTYPDGSIPAFMDQTGAAKKVVLGQLACHEELPEALEMCLLVMGVGEKSRCTVTHHGSALVMKRDTLTPVNARADVAHVPLMYRAEKLFATAQGQAVKKQAAKEKAAKATAEATAPAAADKKSNKKKPDPSLDELLEATKQGEPEIDMERLRELLEKESEKVNKASWICLFSKAAITVEDRRYEYVLELKELTWTDGAPLKRGMPPPPKETEKEEQDRVEQTLEDTKKVRGKGAKALLAGRMFEESKMHAEALVAYRRACKIYAAAESMLMSLANAKQAQKSQRETVKRTLGVVLHNHSSCLRSLAVLAAEAPAGNYVPKVTVNLCNEVAKRCAKQAKDMSKYYLKARIHYVACLVHCGVLEDDYGNNAKGATSELKQLQDRVDTIEIEKFFLEISKEDHKADPVKKEKHADYIMREWKKMKAPVKTLLDQKTQEKKELEKEEKKRKLEQDKIKAQSAGEKLKPKTSSGFKIDFEKSKKREEARKKKEEDRKAKEDEEKAAKDHENVEGDLIKTALPMLSAAVIATGAVAGVGVWLWKMRNRLTKGQPQ